MMTLAKYLSDNSVGYAEFARVLGMNNQNDARTVQRWATGLTIPRPAAMRAIMEATGGKVMPNDFFDLPAPSSANDAPEKAA